ncbi:MAG: FtsW/RodA/SpoVE family cell cycle protein [Culicoidibacterales bacterium]
MAEIRKKSKQTKLVRFAQLKYMDIGLFTAMVILVGIGIFAIYSASIYTAFYEGSSPLKYLVIQTLGLGLGLLAYFTLAVIPYKKYLNIKLIGIGLGLSIATLIYVLTTDPILGASRWIDLGPVNFQPSELTKIVFVLFISYWFVRYETVCYDDGMKLITLVKSSFVALFNPTARKKVKRIAQDKRLWKRVATFWGIPLAIMLTIMVLLKLEPDNGSMIIIFALFCAIFTIIFLRSRKMRLILAGLVVAGGLVILNKDLIAQLIIENSGSDHIVTRFNAWLDPFEDYQGDGYQLANSYIAIAKGGVTGAGIGNGTQKQGFLPEGHTDFILANIAEETGLVGIGAVFALFYFILYRAFKIAQKVEDKQAKLIIFGLIVLFFIQMFWNASGISGLLPMKGLAVPFLGYGGTSIVFMVSTLGIIQSIATNTNYREAKRIEEINHE